MEAVISSFEDLLKDRVAGLDQNQSDLRAKAFEFFEKSGFPSRKNEDYKFTPTDRLIGKGLELEQFVVDTKTTQDLGDLFYDLDASHLVMINGNFDPDLSKVIGDVHVTTSVDIAEHTYSDAFHALNDALHQQTLKLHVAKNIEAKPVVIYHIYDSTSESVFGNPRIEISAEVGGSVNVLEKTVTYGQLPVFINKHTNVKVASNASVNITKVQKYPAHLYQVYNLNIDQERDSRFNSNTYTFSGALVRNNLNIRQLGENCESHMHGLYLLTGKTHVDNHTAVDHTKPNCYSNELYKGILDENSKAVFNGKIYVRPDAQQTNAFQSNKNINLSDSATIHTKPQLEIWADDVKCSHGCTIGQLDEEALFYLRARGLSKASARALMLIAFSEESFEYIPFDFVKDELHALINQRLAG